MKPVAHIRKPDGINLIQKEQTLDEHLKNVSFISALNASKIGLTKAGELIGQLHDFGKYSDVFQNYIRSASGLINQDEDEYVDSQGLKGKIDHSTAGAKYIWNFAKGKKLKEQIAAQLLSLCVASHHSGLIDCLTIDGENDFTRRMGKADNKTHLVEALSKAEPEIIEKVKILLDDTECFGGVLQVLKKIAQTEKNETIIRFQSGLMIRMLYSCLIDADRLDTANFENPKYVKKRQNGKYINWELLIDRLEKKLKEFEDKPGKNKVDILRKLISDACFERSADNTGIFTLTVPTGGGKTLASLRFALHHAKKHMLDRIIYVIPFTSIIDQNAQVVREILEVEKHEEGRIVLEHHSNLMPEIQNWKNKILTENWDAPIIYTTSVQLLETLFGGGTRSARRMHQLANSIIVFDEIQTLPIKTVHMFCNAINYLTRHCNSSVVLCTATQPLLNKVDENKGRINFDKSNEIMPDIETLFADLKRVEVENKIKPQGWETDEIASLSIEQTNDSGSCLVIVNTKKNAQAVYDACSKMTDYPVYHLSTSMCPAHRMEKLTEIRKKLGKEPLICVSTQLIEAGVDVDFGSVIRFVAGLDSIAQAAGRCNRNGLRDIGKVFVINPANETIDSLEDIKVGKEITSERILYYFNQKLKDNSDDLLSPEWMNQYFEYYFFRRASEMSYPVEVGRDDSLLELLSTNGFSVGIYNRVNSKPLDIYFRQSFKTASDAFKAIDAPTQGIVVPYSDKGKKIVADLFSKFAVEQQFKLLKKAQRYTVNVFPNFIKKLQEERAIREVPEIGVLVLIDPRYYHPEFGLSTEIVKEYDPLIQ
ncbi:MAG: CRISPR-associated helicase/endonuclease Cas3 [Odoribacter sp.]|nr:CRISPR-associated helicase/endonuclease Cas3 [Odoribacter sp.]